MGLEVQFSNGLTLPAREALLSRALGRAVRWRFEVFVPLETRIDDLKKLADALGSQRVTAQAKFKPGKEGAEVDLGLPGVVTRAWWADDAHHVVVEAQNTKLGEEQPNPLLPRWRVHHVDDLFKLAGKFKHLALVNSNPVKNALSEVTFPDAARANVVQAGVSDWDFVAMLLWQYRLLGKDEKLKPMIVSGSVAEGSEGKWILTWGSKGAFEAAGEVGKRTFKFSDRDGYERPMLAGRIGEPGGRHSILPGARTPQVGLLRHRRPFSGDSWKGWRGFDAPFFTKERMCWRIVDRLYDTGHPDRPGWTTMLEYLPPEGLVDEEHPPLPFRQWSGLGKVKKNYLKAPWTDIELPGFVAEKNENVVHARLTTLHSGKEGTAGLHLIPEKDTRVEVAWSGRFDESVVCAGNYRQTETQYPHPSVWIESDSIGELKDLQIKAIGVTHIESDWKVDVEKQILVRSREPMKLIGNGVKAHYKGAMMHVSKD